MDLNSDFILTNRAPQQHTETTTTNRIGRPIQTRSPLRQQKGESTKNDQVPSWMSGVFQPSTEMCSVSSIEPTHTIHLKRRDNNICDYVVTSTVQYVSSLLSNSFCSSKLSSQAVEEGERSYFSLVRREGDREEMKEDEESRWHNGGVPTSRSHENRRMSKTAMDEAEFKGEVLMMEENQVSHGDFLLQDADFPDGYVHMAHPDDYKPVDNPLPVTCLLHQKIGHWRLILRVSFRLKNGKYLPMSFVCDTGVPYDFYFSETALEQLIKGGRLKEDEIGNAYLDNVVGRKAAVRETPYTHKPANILGLRMMLKLKFLLSETGFGFSEEFEYF